MNNLETEDYLFMISHLKSCQRLLKRMLMEKVFFQASYWSGHLCAWSICKLQSFIIRGKDISVTRTFFVWKFRPKWLDVHWFRDNRKMTWMRRAHAKFFVHVAIVSCMNQQSLASYQPFPLWNLSSLIPTQDMRLSTKDTLNWRMRPLRAPASRSLWRQLVLTSCKPKQNAKIKFNISVCHLKKVLAHIGA